MSRLSHKPLRKADWTAWTLHGAFGGVVGFFFSFPLARYLPTNAAHMLEIDGLWRINFGLTLLLAGAASHYGERLWFREGLYEPEPPPRSSESKWASMTISFLGAALLLTWIPVGWAGTDQMRSSSSKPNVAMSLALVPPILLLLAVMIHALREDRLPDFWGGFKRHEDPFFFWFSIIAKAIALIGMVNSIL